VNEWYLTDECDMFETVLVLPETLRSKL